MMKSALMYVSAIASGRHSTPISRQEACILQDGPDGDAGVPRFAALARDRRPLLRCT